MEALPRKLNVTTRQGSIPSSDFAPTGPCFLATVSSTAWLLIAYIIVFPTALAYVMQYWALARVDSSVVAFFIYLQPVIATTLSVVLLHERPGFAVLCGGAYAFILMHNHPSGDPSPSQADRQLTRRLAEASNLLQLEMIDHVIAGRPNPDSDPYFSFREMGLL